LQIIQTILCDKISCVSPVKTLNSENSVVLATSDVLIQFYKSIHSLLVKMGKGCDLSKKKKKRERDYEVMLNNTTIKACEIAVACMVSHQCQCVGRIK
jgi:hypothetical protein